MSTIEIEKLAQVSDEQRAAASGQGQYRQTAPAPPQKPSVGRIVHYVLPPNAEHLHAEAAGQHRPATVVRTWPDYARINLRVFLGGTNDAPHGHLIGGQLWASSVAQDEDTKAPGTWHWPERE